MAAVFGARDLFKLVRKGIDVNAVRAHVRKPFRYLLSGDPALIAQFRALLLAGHPDGIVPFDAAACLETLSPLAPPIAEPRDIRAVIFLGRPGDLAAADLTTLRALRVPILSLALDAGSTSSGALNAPAPGNVAEYVTPTISNQALRGRFFPHLIDCSKGVEIAVARSLPTLRETVAAKLTRDAANNSLKVALASAVVDHIPILGVVLGAFASAGDTVAITAIQMMLLLHIEAAYGRDPDIARMWQLLPVIGGGLGWRTLARELAGFVPVAGIAIKGAIAYAGTIVVGEGVMFFLEHGDHMSKGEAAAIYKRTKNDAILFARDFIHKLKKS